MRHYPHYAPRLFVRAFTLIELLVVVGIISILAAIALPNFLEAQIRAKVSRIKNDMRTIAIAVETYNIDNNKYPFRRHTKNYPNPGYNGSEYSEPYTLTTRIPEKSAPEDKHIQATQLSRLTTPIAYLSALYVDIFDRVEQYPDNLIDYWDPIQTMWFINGGSRLGMIGPETLPDRIKSPNDGGYLIVSVGPDGTLGTNTRNGEWVEGWPPPYAEQLSWTMYRPYDSSNGTVSAGNIVMGSQMGGLDGTPGNITRRRPILP